MDNAAVPVGASGTPFRILIADDCDAIRRIVREELFGNGPRDWLLCGESVDGQDALRKAAELQPDAILLDLSIPALSGIEAAKVLQRENPTATLVLMSAQEQAVLERIAAAACVRYCLSKSMLTSQLIPLLANIAQLKRSERQAA